MSMVNSAENFFESQVLGGSYWSDLSSTDNDTEWEDIPVISVPALVVVSFIAVGCFFAGYYCARSKPTVNGTTSKSKKIEAVNAADSKDTEKVASVGSNIIHAIV